MFVYWILLFSFGSKEIYVNEIEFLMKLGLYIFAVLSLTYLKGYSHESHNRSITKHKVQFQIEFVNVVKFKIEKYTGTSEISLV